MKRIAAIVIAAMALAACAELDPTPTAVPTAIPTEKACLELNELIDDSLAGFGRQTDAAS